MRVQVKILQSQNLYEKSKYYSYACSEVDPSYEPKQFSRTIWDPWEGPGYSVEDDDGRLIHEFEMTTDVKVKPALKEAFLNELTTTLTKKYQDDLINQYKLKDIANQVSSNISSLAKEKNHNNSTVGIFSQLKIDTNEENSHLTASAKKVEQSPKITGHHSVTIINNIYPTILVSENNNHPSKLHKMKNKAETFVQDHFRHKR